MALLASLAEIRDSFIIVYGVLGIIFFFVASIVIIIVGLTARALMRNVNGLINDSVKPAVGSVREAADTVRGTTEFIGKNAITPGVRASGMFAGLKKGLGVMGAIGRRKGGK